MANRFWVGNGGNWDDTAHWSLSSGGVSGASIPTASEDVVFDGNSFTIPAQTILLNSATQFHILSYGPTQTTIFNTGNQTISANRISFSPNWGFTLTLGSSVITTHGWSYHIGSNLNGNSTLNAGTSHIIITSPFSDYGFENISFVNPENYYDITIQGDGTASPGYIGGAFYILGSSGFNCHSLTFYNAPLTIVWRDFQAGVYDTAYTATTLTANGSVGKLFTFVSDSPGNYWKISATTASVSYVDVTDSTAGGTGTPFDDRVGGIDRGGNTNWLFMGYLLQQSNIDIVAGLNYKLSFTLSDLISGGSTLKVFQGDTSGQLLGAYSNGQNGVKSIIFTATAEDKITFAAYPLMQCTIDNVSLKRVAQSAVNSNIPIKEFLIGTTDDGREIFFRVDTPAMQFTSVFEDFSIPLAIVTKLQRGSLVKCYVALGDDDFYELEGTAKKGVSIIKIHAADKKNPSPPVARKIRVSWRDGSSQLCRLTQGAVIFSPGTLDYSE